MSKCVEVTDWNSRLPGVTSQAHHLWHIALSRKMKNSQTKSSHAGFFTEYKCEQESLLCMHGVFSDMWLLQCVGGQTCTLLWWLCVRFLVKWIWIRFVVVAFVFSAGSHVQNEDCSLQSVCSRTKMCLPRCFLFISWLKWKWLDCLCLQWAYFQSKMLQYEGVAIAVGVSGTKDLVGGMTTTVQREWSFKICLLVQCILRIVLRRPYACLILSSCLTFLCSHNCWRVHSF